MKILFDEEQIFEMVKMYVMAISGHNISKAGEVLIRKDANGNWQIEASIKTLQLPMPNVTKKTQEDIDKVYSPLANRKLDIS